MDNNFSRRIELLLTNLYQKAKDSGVEDKEQQSFIRGYMAAGLQAGLIDQATLEQIIDAAHHEVFGMSISQKHYDKMISGEDTAFFDVPTVIRHGVKLDLPN